MFDLSKEELLFLVWNYSDIITVAVVSIGVTFFVSKAWNWRREKKGDDQIPGRLGLPFLGETISFLSANNSTRGCYDFVRLRRLWSVIL
jgi:hypothetical protein